jgi:class 3 adenylate cyclase
MSKFNKNITEAWEKYLSKNDLYFLDQSLESEFFEYYVGSAAIATHVFMAIGGFAFLSYVNLDRLIDPDSYYLANNIRIFYATPLIFFCVFILFFAKFKSNIEYVVLFNAFVIISAQMLIFLTLEDGYKYAASGFVIIFFIRAINYIIRATHLLLIAIFSIFCTIAGSIFSDSELGWILINSIGILTAVILGMIVALTRERRARRLFMANRSLAKSRARAETLISSLLPGSIMHRVRSGEKDIADKIEEVGVVFADIVDFTSLSRRLSPTDLIRLLDDIFSRFDRAAELWNMQKITTIGDAYMAIGGMHCPEQSREIAISAASFAIAIRKEMDKVIQETGYPINLRIGVHIGPVVVGVVGDRRPTFDCWGDTVRTASSLEGQAAVGAILISDQVFEALGDNAEAGPVQPVRAKGVEGEIPARELKGLKNLMP